MDIVFILVEPSVPENIGASARALKTMGFKNLRLINPSTTDEKKIRTVAHASGDILDHAGIFQDFDEATADLDFLIATAAKKRRTNENYISAGNLFPFLLEKENHLKKTGIVFGPEESGLSNEEIKKCDLISYVPMNGSYPSLNLSHAVMVYAYHLSGLPERKDIQVLQSEESHKALKGKIVNILEDLEIKQSHIIVPRIMERISFLKDEDISLLHAIGNAYLKKYKN